MRQFNKIPRSTSDSPSRLQPLVHGTYQAYLRRYSLFFFFSASAAPELIISRTPQQLAECIADAEAHGYSLGIKLVRGAYHPHEVAVHTARKIPSSSPTASISPDEEPPVWLTKEETDKCYDSCVRMLIEHVERDVAEARRSGSQVPRISVIVASHNRNSCMLVLDELVKSGLARVEGKLIRIGKEVTDRLALAHLYGENKVQGENMHAVYWDLSVQECATV